jgi:hypothetical protein
MPDVVLRLIRYGSPVEFGDHEDIRDALGSAIYNIEFCVGVPIEIRMDGMVVMDEEAIYRVHVELGDESSRVARGIYEPLDRFLPPTAQSPERTQS